MKRNPLVNALILVVLALVWGSSYILMKRGLVSFSPLQIASMRMFFAALALLPFALKALRTIPTKKWTFVAVVAFVGSGLPSYLYPLSVQGIGSAVPGVINALTPLFTLLIGAMFFGVAITYYGLAGVTIGLGGALVLIIGTAKGGFSLKVLYLTCAVLATVSYGLSTHVLKRHLSSFPALQVTAATFLLLFIPSVALFILSEGYKPLANATVATYQSLGYVALLGVVGTAMALVLFNYLIQQTSALLATSVTYLIPFVALLWGAYDGELIRYYHILGLGFILAGILLIRKGSRIKAKENL